MPVPIVAPKVELRGGRRARGTSRRRAPTPAGAPPSPALARELFRLALVIAEEWRLHASELASLLGTSPRTLARWKSAAEIESPTPDVLDRLRLTLRMYEDLLALGGSLEGARSMLRAERTEPAPTPRNSWLARMTTGRLLDLAAAQRELQAHVMG